MNVLSLFDGMSCGQIALGRSGINVQNYFASEIDKYAIRITIKNYPQTIQLGDINNWESWELPKIDLLIGGSPCQGFSIAGKQLNFNDHRSKLFFKFADILKSLKLKNPGIKFILENVKMKQEYQDVISNILGVDPIFIDSALVSAQSKKRLYWTNIAGVSIPNDKKIILGDIIENGYVDKLKSYCIDANYMKGGNIKQYFYKRRRQLVFDKPIRIKNIGNGGQGERVYSINGKSVCLSALGGGMGAKTGLYETEIGIRKLTPTECERLQTVPDNYTAGVSDTQRYKMLGNGFTVNVISHILNCMKVDKNTNIL